MKKMNRAAANMNNAQEAAMNNQEITFNDAAYAQDIIEKSAAKDGKIKIALITSIVSMVTLFTGLGMEAGILESILVIVYVATLVATYILAGPKNVFKRFGKIAYYGWLAIPIFPVDLVFVGMTFSFAIYSLLMLPVIYVVGEYFRNKKERKEAEEYLSYCTI